jgi:hypothetical protein
MIPARTVAGGIGGAIGLIISLSFLTMRRRTRTVATRTVGSPVEVYEERRYDEPQV